MTRDDGSERMRELTTQHLLTEDQLANYPSYGWPIKCPACPAPRGGGNTIRLPDCDGVRGACVLCGAPLLVERFERIISVSSRARVKQMHIKDYNEGIAQGVRGNFQEARRVFQEAMSYGGVHFDRPLIECSQLAEDAIQARIPQQVAIHMFRAVDSGDIGNESQRQAELEAAIQIAPRYARAHCDLGEHYGVLGQTEKAIQEFSEALSCDENFASAHFNLGVAYDKIGRSDESVHHYQQAIALDDSFAEAHNNLGFYYAASGNYEQAKTHWYRAVELRYLVGISAIKRACGIRSSTSGCMSVVALAVLISIGIVVLILVGRGIA